MVVASNNHLPEKKYCALVDIGGELTWSVFWRDDLEEAESDLRCMINNLNYELVETMECEGVYPERVIMMEEKYQSSGRTNGLFTGLMTEDVKISDDNPQ